MITSSQAVLKIYTRTLHLNEANTFEVCFHSEIHLSPYDLTESKLACSIIYTALEKGVSGVLDRG